MINIPISAELFGSKSLCLIICQSLAGPALSMSLS